MAKGPKRTGARQADVDTSIASLPLVAPAGSGPVRLSEDDSGARFLLYATDKGVRHELRFEGEQPWFTQKQLADMFDVDTDTVGDHIKVFLASGELDATTGSFPVVQLEGTRQVRRATKHYTLDVAVYVGYRVNSAAGVLFRKWATAILVQFATRGFVVDTERLKNTGEPDALDEFREIARDIRTSIRNSYREVLKLCSLCADYDGSSETAREFFQAMENKLLWAAAGKTAPQLVIERANAEAVDMGLTYFAGRRGPSKRDVNIGNNYPAPGEQRTKGRVTDMWLTYVEDQLEQGRLPTMSAVIEKLDGFITFNQWPLLIDRGSHSRGVADRHALAQLERCRERIRAALEP